MAENTFISGETNGANAVAHEFDTTVALITSGAKLASWKNANVEKFYIDKDGQLINPQTDSFNFKSYEAHIAGAVAFSFNTHNLFSSSTERLISIQNKDVEKFYIDANGNIHIKDTLGAYLYFEDTARYIRSYTPDAGTTWEMWLRYWNNYKFYSESGAACFWILSNGELDIFGKLKSFKATGTNAFELDTNITFITGNLLSVKNNTSEKFAINPNGNVTLAGTLDGVDIAAHDHNSAFGQSRLSAKDRTRFATTEKHSADSAASDILNQHSFFRAKNAIAVTKVYFLPDAALTADDTNYAVITVHRIGTAGVIGSISTKTIGSGGSGNWTAFIPVDFGTINVPLAIGDGMSFRITKGNAGVIVPSGTIQVEYTIN